MTNLKVDNFLFESNVVNFPQLQQSQVTNLLSEPQQALLSTINTGQDIIVTVEKELIESIEVPELGSDPVCICVNSCVVSIELLIITLSYSFLSFCSKASLKWKESTLDTNKQNVSSQIAAMNAATAQVVTLTAGPPEEVDHTAVGAAITTITSNLPEMTRGVRMIAALMDDENSGDRLLDAARRLCNAFSDLLRAAEPETREVTHQVSFSNLVTYILYTQEKFVWNLTDLTLCSRARTC